LTKDSGERLPQHLLPLLRGNESDLLLSSLYLRLQHIGLVCLPDIEQLLGSGESILRQLEQSLRRSCGLKGATVGNNRITRLAERSNEKAKPCESQNQARKEQWCSERFFRTLLGPVSCKWS
jgi:hypothetical protein